MKNRYGSIYVMTLVASLVLVALVLTFSYRLMAFRQSARIHTDSEQAYIYAELALRHALYLPQTTSNWRQLLTNGLWLDTIQLDKASYSVWGTDPVDGDLSNNNTDPVTLKATASVNGVSRTLQVQIQPKPSELLQYALVSGAVSGINHQSLVYGDVFSNSDVLFDTNYPRVEGNVRVNGTVNRPSRVTGTVAVGVAQKNIPTWDDVAPYYLNLATIIPYCQNFNSIYLSPNWNTAGGPVNPHGLYLIDCQNQNVNISNAVIWGTLLIKNPGPYSKIDGDVNWAPYRSDFPALLANGNLLISFTSFSDIQGLVYVQGNVKFTGQARVFGTAIVTGQAMLENLAYINYESVGNVKGFVNDTLSVAQGSWREVLPSNP